MQFSFIPSKSAPELDPYYLKTKRKRKSVTKLGNLVSTFTTAEARDETAQGFSKLIVKSKPKVPIHQLPQFRDFEENVSLPEPYEAFEKEQNISASHVRPRGFSKSDMLLNLITETKIIRKFQPKIPKSKIRLRMSADRLRLLLRQWSDQVDKAEDDSCDDDAESCTDTDDQTDIEDSENSTSASRQTSCIDLRSEFSTSKKHDAKKDSAKERANDIECLFNESTSESTSKSQSGVKHKALVKGETQDRLMKNILSEHIASMMETSGFTHVKLGALDTIVGLTHNFISDLCKRLKLAKEKELGGIDHGFPDPMERILTHIGYGGVRGLEPEFRSYVSSLFDPEDLKLKNPEDTEPPSETNVDPPPVP